MTFPQSLNISGTCVFKCLLEIPAIWKVFSRALGPVWHLCWELWRAECFPLPFFHESKTRSALLKSCWTMHRIRCLNRKWLLQCGSGLGRTRAENPSEILTPLTLINNLFCKYLCYFPTSENARHPFTHLTQIQGQTLLTHLGRLPLPFSQCFGS